MLCVLFVTCLRCTAGYKVCMAVKLHMEDWPIGSLQVAWFSSYLEL